MIAGPGLIRHTGAMARIRCGRLDRRPDAVLAGYVEEIRAAGIDITLSDDMLLEIWKKFVLLSGTSGATASTRQPLGVIRDDLDMRAFLPQADAGDHGGRPGERRRVPIGLSGGTGFVAGIPPTMRASMANDLEAGNRLELDWLAGKVVALGRKHGIPTPSQEAVYAILKPFRMGRAR